MSEVRFIIPGKPQGKARPRLGKYCTYTPQKTVDYEKLIKSIYESEGLPKLFGAIRAEIEVVYDIPKSTTKKAAAGMLAGELYPAKKPDIDNILKIVFDALNGIAYKDDNHIVEVLCRKRYGLQPYVEVKFIELEATE